MINSIVSQGLIWAILGLGIFMTFRILDLPRGSIRSLRRWLLLVQDVWRALRRVFSTQKEEFPRSCQGSS